MDPNSPGTRLSYMDHDSLANDPDTVNEKDSTTKNTNDEGEYMKDCKTATHKLHYVIIFFDKDQGQFTELTFPRDEDGSSNTTQGIGGASESALITETVSSENPLFSSESQPPGADDVKSTERERNEVDSITPGNGDDGACCDSSSPSGVVVCNGKKKRFPVNPEIRIILKYQAESKQIMGSITSELGLCGRRQDVCNPPEYVHFQIAIYPQDEYRLKTKWVPASRKTLAWNFLLGPFDEEFDADQKSVRLRLYGKSKSMIPRCYGECFVPLSDVVENEGSVEFTEILESIKKPKNPSLSGRRSDLCTIKGNGDDIWDCV